MRPETCNIISLALRLKGYDLLPARCGPLWRAAKDVWLRLAAQQG
jgi:hypothetical protein